MSQHVGEWHTLTIDEGGEIELNHPECPPAERQDDDFLGPQFLCSMAEEVTNCGFENFEDDQGGPLPPGVYRARFSAWSTYSHYYGSEEWDSCVEVERLPVTATTKK
jgi:hypothetical protein